MTGILWNPTTHQTIEKFPDAFLCNVCLWAHRTGILLAQQILGQLEQIPSRSTTLFVLGRFLVSTRLVKWVHGGISTADDCQSSRGQGATCTILALPRYSLENGSTTLALSIPHCRTKAAFTGWLDQVRDKEVCPVQTWHVSCVPSCQG